MTECINSEKMKVLVFDTETTGLPASRNVSITETDKWPYIVQISWVLYDTDERVPVEMVDHIIDCEVEIPEESTKIHGITRRRASLRGIPISAAMDDFDDVLQRADLVVAHNISFDKRVYMVEAIRRRRRQYFTRDGVRKPEYCTMKNNKERCAIQVTNAKGDTYLKYPNLSELYEHVFGHRPKGTHDSMADVLICLRCYVALEYGYDILKTHAKTARLFELHCS